MIDAMTITVEDFDYRVDTGAPLDISIAVGAGVTAFGADRAAAHAYTAEGFTGSVKDGGSCNCASWRFSPHLHGTHTEGVGHIAAKPANIYEDCVDTLIPATVLTVVPVPGAECGDGYEPEKRRDDLLITAAGIEHAMETHRPGFLRALVVRTLPNTDDKKSRRYRPDEPPPFFSIEAMEYILGLGVKHLLVDTPSVDRMDDDGRLTAHHIFWEVERGARPETARSDKTITELVYVPDAVPDGPYLLNLQVSAFTGDAAPSRPVLYPVEVT